MLRLAIQRIGVHPLLDACKQLQRTRPAVHPHPCFDGATSLGAPSGDAFVDGEHQARTVREEAHARAERATVKPRVSENPGRMERSLSRSGIGVRGWETLDPRSWYGGWRCGSPPCRPPIANSQYLGSRV